VGIGAGTPNEAELEALHHVSIGRNIAELEKRGLATLKGMALQSLLVTRGKDGMALFERGRTSVAHIPVHGSNQAVDVTGAGDTVLAAYTLALACGAKPFDAAHIANIAGGLVVMKRGTAVVTRGELLAAIRGEVSGSGPGHASCSPEDRRAQSLAGAGKKPARPDKEGCVCQRMLRHPARWPCSLFAGRAF